MVLFSLILTVVNVLLSTYWLLQGDIHYDVDVSRDFLVLDDIVRNSHFTLLGPRSGAIPGIFHGPLWFYVNLPAYYLGNGNPIFIGWFWWGLSAIFLGIIFWVTKKLFDLKTAILAILLYSANSIINPSIGLKNFYNPYGAVFLVPVFFYLFYQYISKLRVKYLLASFFTLGLIIQFQMAFGIPVLLTATAFLGYFLIKKGKPAHFLSYLILLIPLSTFILFDIKHNGLQLNSFMQFISHKEGLSQNFIDLFSDRVRALVFDAFDQFSPGKNYLTLFYTAFFLGGFIVVLKKKIFPQRLYLLYGGLFLGFWIVSLFYSGGVGNYFWPFLPLTIIIFCSFYKAIRKEIFIPVFLVLYLSNLYAGISAILDFNTDANKRGPHSWAFNLLVAQRIYQDTKGDFGYFSFSPDRFAYQQRYAMIYAKKEFPGINSYSSVKRPVTYLLQVDPPPGRPELNGTSWRISDVKIDRPPDQSFRFDFIQVDKYFLDSNEINMLPNPYLLDNVFIR